MPKYFLSKKQHLHDRAKWGMFELGKRMVGGQPIDPAEHAEHVAGHAEADVIELRNLCGVCGDTFVPEPWPNNKHMIINAHSVLLPGGVMLQAGTAPDGVSQREIPIGVCPECCDKTSLLTDVEHDWDSHDHFAKPLTK